MCFILVRPCLSLCAPERGIALSAYHGGRQRGVALSAYHGGHLRGASPCRPITVCAWEGRCPVGLSRWACGRGVALSTYHWPSEMSFSLMGRSLKYWCCSAASADTLLLGCSYNGRATAHDTASDRDTQRSKVQFPVCTGRVFSRRKNRALKSGTGDVPRGSDFTF